MHDDLLHGWAVMWNGEAERHCVGNHLTVGVTRCGVVRDNLGKLICRTVQVGYQHVVWNGAAENNSTRSDGVRIGSRSVLSHAVDGVTQFRVARGRGMIRYGMETFHTTSFHPVWPDPKTCRPMVLRGDTICCEKWRQDHPTCFTRSGGLKRGCVPRGGGETLNTEWCGTDRMGHGEVRPKDVFAQGVEG